jgi:hypothetical protein
MPADFVRDTRGAPMQLAIGAAAVYRRERHAPSVVATCTRDALDQIHAVAS